MRCAPTAEHPVRAAPVLALLATGMAQGQPIARSDSSGVGTGAHLHFEVIENATPGDWRSGQSVDPRQHVTF